MRAADIALWGVVGLLTLHLFGAQLTMNGVLARKKAQEMFRLRAELAASVDSHLSLRAPTYCSAC